MFAFVLLFAVVLAQTTVTCDPKKGQVKHATENKCICDTTKGFKDNDGADKATVPCKCTDTTHKIVNTTANNVLSYTCQACNDATHNYDANTLACTQKPVTCDPKKGEVKHASENKCICDTTKGFKDNDGADKATVPCKCTDTTHKIVNKTGASNTLSYACEACNAATHNYDTNTLACTEKPATCDPKKGQVKHASENKCICDTTKGFKDNDGADKATVPCKCTDTTHKIVNTTANNVLSYTCQACNAATHNYDTNTLTCTIKPTTVTCDKPGQTKHATENKCVCTVTGFKENTGDDKTTKPCVCSNTGANIIKKTGANNAITYECLACGSGETYDKTNMICVKPVTCDEKKGEVKHATENKCECDTQKGFSNKETNTSKPVNCGCASNAYVVKGDYNGKTIYQCGECPSATIYFKNELTCKPEADAKTECGKQAGAVWGANGKIYEDRCTCDTAKGFAKDGTQGKLCKCATAGHNIIKEGTTYKCQTCPSDKPDYNATAMECYKKTTVTCDAAKGQKLNNNKCECDTANGFENKEKDANKPINCACKEANHYNIKNVTGTGAAQKTTYKCAKCEGNTPDYDATNMKCYKKQNNGVNGLFVVLAMALFFLF